MRASRRDGKSLRLASSITGVVLSLVLSPPFEDATADGIRLTFTLATVVLAAVALVLYWICFRSTREVVPAGSGDAQVTSHMVQQNTDEVLDHVKAAGGVIVARAAEQHGLTPEAAAQRQVREDRMCPRMSRRLMGCDPRDASRYHLIIDTSQMGEQEIVEEIIAAVQTELGE